MRLVGYLRVSTDVQVEGLGLEIQEAAIREWAKTEGHELVNLFTDAGVSGSNGLEHRHGLPEALDRLRKGRNRPEGLVVYRLDRLARDLMVQEQVLADIWRAGAQVFSTSAGEAPYLTDDPDDPARKFIRQVLGAVAEYERATIRMRLEAGRRRKAAQGGWVQYGGVPYGKRLDAARGVLEDDPHEQAGIQLALRLRDEGLSLREIGLELVLEGYPPRRAKWWSANMVGTIIGRANEAA